MRAYLCSIRDKNGLTKRELSQRLGISESYYNLIEHGSRQKNISVRFLYELSKVLNVSVKTLIDQEIDYINTNH